MTNKAQHNPKPQPQESLQPFPLFESLEFKDLEGMMKPRIHVDEFSSKMGDDDDIIVVSFFVRDAQAAKDLMTWFEKGYDFVLDADKSPGEIKPNRWLVYVEMRRRSTAGGNVEMMLDDLGTLTEYTKDDWTMHYKDKDYPFTRDTFDNIVPTSPKEYRKRYESEMNEWRVAAGLQTKQIYERDDAMKSIQSAAGII
jgi:hypothetical protein